MMELLDGVSLGKYLRDRLPDEAEIRHILLQCCSALAASHQHGIVHRDLKPENIYLVKRGGDDHFVKVLDFGIAKLLAGRPGSGRTRIGTILGTPHYMSPEQCRGRGDVDPRSDVYALGVVLYEMLCGQVPFEGTLGEVLQAQVQAVPVPPSQRFPQVPAGLEAIAMRCLEKDKTARFQTMDELAEALRDPAAHLASRPQPVAAPPRAAPDAPTLHLAPITASIPPLERHARLGRELRAWVLPLAIGLITALVLAGGSVYLRGWLDQRVTISAPARR
jgi:serine/threonine-protein kinase